MFWLGSGRSVHGSAFPLRTTVAGAGPDGMFRGRAAASMSCQVVASLAASKYWAWLLALWIPDGSIFGVSVVGENVGGMPAPAWIRSVVSRLVFHFSFTR